MNYIRIPLCILFLAFFTNFLFGNEITRTYHDAWGTHGIHLTEWSDEGLEVRFSLESLAIQSSRSNPGYHIVSLPGVYLPAEPGKPDLPSKGRYIAVPKNATPKVTVTSYRYEIIEGVDISPSRGIPPDQQEYAPRTKEMEIYGQDRFYPTSPVVLSEVTEIRGVDIVMLGISPVQYNPVSREVKILRDIEVEISFSDGDGYWVEERLRNHWWETIMSDIILNYDQLNEGTAPRNNEPSNEGAEYLIITQDDPAFLAWADSIKEFRVKQGISTHVEHIGTIGGNELSTLQAYIEHAYAHWEVPPVAILLLGDYDEGDEGIISYRFNHSSSGFGGTYITDNPFGDMTGNKLPDIVVSRITANNEEELETMVSKFIMYESHPPENPAFYANPITAVGWQTDRWFQLCSEVVGGFWKHACGKEPIRINSIFSGNPDDDIWSTAENTTAVVNYFGSGGSGLGYIPETPTQLGNWRGGRAIHINNAINSGAFMVLHRDHGERDGWSQPYYRNPSVGSLENTDLPFVLSVNCLTGQFNHSRESFAERLHRYHANGQPSGAVGVIAASQVSFSFVNDTYVWGVINNMWPDFMPDYGISDTSRRILPAFANAAGKYFLEQSSWPSNPNEKQVTYELFHHHGDAFLNIYSEVPQELQIHSHNVLRDNANDFQFTANEGAFIALTYFCDVSQERIILGTAKASGEPMDISLDYMPDTHKILLTATKQNHYRYTKPLYIVPGEAPYIAYEAAVTANAEGNDTEATYGTSFFLHLTLANIGDHAADDVSVTLDTSDPHIVSLTQNTGIDYGTMEPGYSHTITDAFFVELATDVPDNKKIPFYISSTDAASQVFHDTLHIRTKSPLFNVVSTGITDANNTQLEYLRPGEEMSLDIAIKNTGHAKAQQPKITAECSNPYIQFDDYSVSGPSLEPGDTQIYSFQVATSPNVPRGYDIPVRFTIENGNKKTISLDLPVGPHLDFTMGDEHLTARQFPFNNHYTSNRTQMLFRTDELGIGSKIIEGISFQFSNASQSPNYQKLPNFVIRVTNTNSSQLDEGFIDMTDADTLYYASPMDMPKHTGWFRFDIDPFEYHFADSHVVLDISWGHFLSNTRDPYQVYHSEYNDQLTAYGYSNDTYYPQYPSYSGSSNARPNVVFHYSPISPQKERDVELITLNSVEETHIRDATITIGSKTMQTNQEGQAVVELFDGSYTASIQHIDHHDASEDFFVTSQMVVFPFFLDPVYQLSFSVYDTKGNTIDDAVLLIEDEEFIPGEYFFDHLRPGQYAYTARRAGYHDATGEFQLYDNYTKHIEIALSEDQTGIVSGDMGNEILVYPNPTHSTITVMVATGHTFDALQLINATGQTVHTADLTKGKYGKEVLQIDMQPYPRGIYLVRLSGGNTSVTKRIIKK